MALRLAILPPAYALLHDLRLPGSTGNVDHLVIGPGGAFVVVTRRCAHCVELRDGQLWADSHSLGDLLTAADVESRLLTQLLGTPVVGVVALLEATLPAAMPSHLGGVLVCAGGLVGRVISRTPHTLLTPLQVADLTERARPLLHDPRSVPRTESALGVRAEPSPDMSVVPIVPPHAPASPQSVLRRRATQQAALGARQRTSSGREPQRRRRAASAATDKEASGRLRSIRFIAVALLIMCVIAIAFGSLISAIWGDDDAGAARPACASVRAAPTVERIDPWELRRVGNCRR